MVVAGKASNFQPRTLKPGSSHHRCFTSCSARSNLAKQLAGSHRTTPTRKQVQMQASSTDAAVSETRSWMYPLKDGVRLEVLSREVSGTDKPTLLFIHGASHGAWCWQEKFLPYFHSNGFSCHAISLRAQGGSDKPEGLTSGGSLASHADDISDFIKANIPRPVVVGHSFGGLVLESYICRDYDQREKLKGVCLLAAAPPQGNKDMVNRIFRKSIWNGLRLIWSWSTKAYLKSPAGTQFVFFSEDLPKDLVERYSRLLRENRSEISVIDVNALKEECPLPQPPPNAPPILVLGGDTDKSVDLQALQETAGHFGSEPVVLHNIAHDMMIDTRWEDAARELEKWVLTL